MKLIISEEEKKRILGLHGSLISEGIRASFDFDEWIGDNIGKPGVMYNVWTDGTSLNLEYYPKQQNSSYFVLSKGNCESSNKNDKGVSFPNFVSSIKGKQPRLYEGKIYKDSNDFYLQLKPKKSVQTTGILSVNGYQDDGSSIFIRSWGGVSNGKMVGCQSKDNQSISKTAEFEVKKNNDYIDDFLSDQIINTQKLGKQIELIYYVKVENGNLMLSKDIEGTVGVIKIYSENVCSNKSQTVRKPGFLTLKEVITSYPDLQGEFKITIPYIKSLLPYKENYMYMAMTPVGGGSIIYLQSDCPANTVF